MRVAVDGEFVPLTGSDPIPEVLTSVEGVPLTWGSSDLLQGEIHSGAIWAGKALSIEEYELMMFERGILLKDDFILMNKLQQYFQINLRKDGQDFGQNMRSKVDKASPKKEEKGNNKVGIAGSDIEIFEP